MPTAEDLGNALIRECRSRLLEESLPRLLKCMGELTDLELWMRPNEESNSVGNLALHLCGNVRQYVISGLGGEEDVRERPREFSERGPIPRATLIARLEETLGQAARVLESVKGDSLLETHGVQGREITGLSILVHVVEHFSYHVGQVAYFVKARKGKDLGFYAGRNLNLRNAPPRGRPPPKE
jgi:uncharacterized damage-inducible protein DinB